MWMCPEHRGPVKEGHVWCHACVAREDAIARTSAKRTAVAALSAKSLLGRVGRALGRPDSRVGTPYVHMESGSEASATGTPRGTPLWLTSLVGGIVASMMLAPLSNQTGFKEVQGYLFWAIISVSAGTLLWVGKGLFTERQGSRTARIVSGLGMLMNLMAALGALWLRFHGGR
jgi:hypothetical protein